MKFRFILIAIPVLTFASCDKIKNLTNQAKSAVGTAATKSPSDSTPDPELQKLVDQTPEGVLFRKDIPFPNNIEVTNTRKDEMVGMYSEKSEIGSQVTSLRGTMTVVTKFQRAGDKLTYTQVESKFEKSLTKEEIKSKESNPIPVTPPREANKFVKSGNTWKPADSTNFSTVALAQKLSPVFDQLLVNNGLASPTQWFGKRRLKIGDSLSLTGNTLAMILPGDATGTLKLTLESVSAVDGHPCGVFAISGNYDRNHFPDFQGNFTDEKTTIQSGKIWFSLIYPLILRMEFDTIQTQRVDGNGGLSTRGQGSVKVSLIRQWKKTGP